VKERVIREESERRSSTGPRLESRLNSEIARENSPSAIDCPQPRRCHMAITLTENNGGKVLEVQVNGKLTHVDYQQFAPRFEAMLKLHGKLSVLFEMVDFHGWEAAALWDDIKFDVKHFSDIKRLAMVGDK